MADGVGEVVEMEAAVAHVGELLVLDRVGL